MPTIKNKKNIATTKLFKIEELDINFSKNIDRKYEVISGTGEGAVMVLPVLNDNLIFIKEYAAAIDDYSLTFPKGKIDKQEKILEAANRELQEEIGFKANKMVNAYTLDLAPGYINHKTHIIIASELKPSKLEGDEPEKLEIVKCPVNSIPTFLAQQKNIDSRVFAAIFIYLNFLQDE